MNIDSTNFDIDAFVEDTFKDDRVTTSYSKQDAKHRAKVNMLKREISDIGKQKIDLEKQIDSMQKKFDNLSTLKDRLMSENREMRNIKYANHDLNLEINRLREAFKIRNKAMDDLNVELSVANDMIDFAQRYIDYVKEYLPEGVKSPIEFYAEVRHEYK
jgi:chromosome segregation ATPase